MAASKPAEQRQDENGGLLDITGVAERLGVTERYIRRLVAERRIPYIKLGGPIRFDPNDVERLIEESRRPALRSGPEGSNAPASRRPAGKGRASKRP